MVLWKEVRCFLGLLIKNSIFMRGVIIVSSMKRAILYLKRKKARAVAMLLLLFLMSCSVLVGVSLKKSTEKEMEQLRQSLASGFLLKVDTRNEMYFKTFDDGIGIDRYDYAGPMITEGMIEKILSMDGVTDYNVDQSARAWTNLKLRPGLNASIEPDPNPDPNEIAPYTEERVAQWRGSILLYACRNGSLHKNFRSGALTMAEGRNMKAGDHYKALISDWLAEENHLSVGDTITFEVKEGDVVIPSKEPMKTIGEPIDLEIVGIFHANVSLPYSELTLEQSYIENSVYTDMDAFAKLKAYYHEEGWEQTHINVEFLVEDPGQLDSIMQKVENWDELDLENMRLEVDDSAYRALAKPYRQIRFFAMLLLAAGLGGLGIILYLILMFWMQGRRHEIGILYSIGMKKSSILGQMLAECLLMSAAALLFAFVLSGPVVNACSDAAESLTAPKEDAEEFRTTLWAFTPVITRVSSDGAVLEHTVSGSTVWFMVLFVCGVSSVSVMLSFVKISSAGLKKLLQ